MACWNTPFFGPFLGPIVFSLFLLFRGHDLLFLGGSNFAFFLLFSREKKQKKSKNKCKNNGPKKGKKRNQKREKKGLKFRFAFLGRVQFCFFFFFFLLFSREKSKKKAKPHAKTMDPKKGEKSKNKAKRKQAEMGSMGGEKANHGPEKAKIMRKQWGPKRGRKRECSSKPLKKNNRGCWTTRAPKFSVNFGSWAPLIRPSFLDDPGPKIFGKFWELGAPLLLTKTPATQVSRGSC